MMFSTKEPILVIFDRIKHDDHVERILFYEENTEFIFALEETKQYYFAYHYVRSLYALGKYENVISEIDPLIEYTFLNQIEFLPKRTFENLLFKKANSFIHTVKFKEAINIGEQLLGMHPTDLDYRKFLEKAYRSHLNFKSTEVRLTALILIFGSAIVSAIFWFVITDTQNTSLTQSFLVIISPCFLAMGLLGSAHLYNYLKSIRQVDVLIEQKLKKPKSH